MSTLDALLAAIIDRPDDDTPRLVYADCLDDMGETARAEFIRVQVEAARGSGDRTMRLWDLLHHSEGWFADVVKAFRFEWSNWGVIHDGTIHFESKRAPGEFFVRRGFVAEVRCPLAVWTGGECGRCGGQGGALDPAGPTAWQVCPACSGTGRTPGIGPRLVAAQPVTRVVTDREPWSFGEGEFGWFSEGGPDATARSTLPPDLTTPMGIVFGRPFPSRAAALDALSAALLAWARTQNEVQA